MFHITTFYKLKVAPAYSKAECISKVSNLQTCILNHPGMKCLLHQQGINLQIAIKCESGDSSYNNDYMADITGTNLNHIVDVKLEYI